MALVARASEKITVAAAAVGFTAAKAYPEGSKVVVATCKVEDAPIRVNTKNTPTAAGAEGSILYNPGDVFEVWGYADLKNFLAIRTTGVSGTLMAIFQGEG